MFDEFWAKYPRRIAKKAAQKSYAKAVKDIPHAAIMASLDLMLATEWAHRRPEYIPHASTWLNRESFEERHEAIEDECERPIGLHLCDVCRPEHEWREDGPEYLMAFQWRYTCPEARMRMREAIQRGLAKTKMGASGR